MPYEADDAADDEDAHAGDDAARRALLDDAEAYRGVHDETLILLGKLKQRFLKGEMSWINTDV